MMRMHFGASWSLVGSLASAVFGPERCREIVGDDATGGVLGSKLCAAAEEQLLLLPGEMAKMTMAEAWCLTCERTHVAICYPADTPQECPYCGTMTGVLFPATKDGE